MQPAVAGASGSRTAAAAAAVASDDVVLGVSVQELSMSLNKERLGRRLVAAAVRDVACEIVSEARHLAVDVTSEASAGASRTLSVTGQLGDILLTDLTSRDSRCVLPNIRLALIAFIIYCYTSPLLFGPATLTTLSAAPLFAHART